MKARHDSAMGWIKDQKANMVGGEARRAFDEGHTVFTPKLNTPSSQPNMSGNIDTWAMMVASIEDAGWTLTHWQIASDAKGNPAAYPLFRRR